LVGLVRKANHNKASHNDATHTLKIWFDPFADSGLNPKIAMAAADLAAMV
jgi:hypothetical protein